MNGGPTAQPECLPRWQVHLRQLEAAFAAGDVRGVVRAWHAASLAARAAPDWRGVLAVGTAALRVGRATGRVALFGAEARQALSVAAFRAHRGRSLEGLRQVEAAFAALGDHQAALECRRLAEALESADGDDPALGDAPFPGPAGP